MTSWWTGEQAPHNSQWSSCCAWRLAVLPPLSSAWSLRIVRKLTRGAPCFTGLIDGYCSHWLRRLFRPHWAYFALLRSSIRNSRLATLPLASLLCSLDFRFACFAHCARRSSVPQAAASVRPAKNARNDVHAVISDLSLVLPILCQCSGREKSRFFLWKGLTFDSQMYNDL